MLIKTSSKTKRQPQRIKHHADGKGFTIERGKMFTPEQMQQMKAAFKERLDAKMQADAGYQRNQLMTNEERARIAIDRMTEQRIEYDAMRGVETTETEARAVTQVIADRSEQRKLVGDS